ncbi:MAG TPA: hypothetical protein VL171_10795 [Verrucomicrobiae bacterium]|nr:hypothetical protein [Verrucomicrobiae bacterium]
MQILLALTTVLGSGVLAAFVAHKFAERREEREFRRRKSEELFLAVHGYCITFVSRNMLWPRVMDGEMDYNKVLDINAEDKAPTPGHYETMQMLINIYFPDLLPDFRAILAAREPINDMKANFRNAYERGTPTRQFSEPFSRALLKFEHLCDELKTKICHHAQHKR